MVERAAIATNPAAAQPHDELLVFNEDIESAVDAGAALGECGIERCGLDDVSREAIEHGAAGGVRPADALEEHPNGHVVWDEIALRHVFVSEHAKLGLILDVFAEHVAGGDVDEPGRGGDALSLRALAGAWRSQAAR